MHKPVAIHHTRRSEGYNVEGFNLLLTQASNFAGPIDNLFLALLGVSLVVLGTLAILAIVFIFKYRRGKKVERQATSPGIQGSEIIWTIIPIFIFLGLFVWGARLYFSMLTVPKDQDLLEIQVTGKQWMWKLQHPDGQREINALHIPLGQPVKLLLSTQDVIHSFYIPEFRIKMDAVPGRYTELWFTPTKLGEYKLMCTEFCGTEHSYMGGRVVVMRPEEYETWLRTASGGMTLAKEGEQLFRAHGCSGCHAPASTVHAPPLDGIFGRVVALADGSTVVADRAYIRDSILLPEKQIAAGYPPIMPSFKGLLSEEDILKLVAYIESLTAEQAAMTSEETP